MFVMRVSDINFDKIFIKMSSHIFKVESNYMRNEISDIINPFCTSERN